MSTLSSQLPRRFLKKWTKREYSAMVDRGAFAGQHIYLFRGDLIDMSPQGSQHSFVVARIAEVLFEAFGNAAHIRTQSPFDAPGESMPEPDVAVYPREQNRPDAHPSRAIILVEVSCTSLEEDREKAIEYAAAGVGEYWIIDVPHRQVEVHRDPQRDEDAKLGFRYSSLEVLTPAQSIAPLAKPDVSIPVSRLLP